MSTVYNYNDQITAYHDERVNLPEKIRADLRRCRKANQNRIINNMREGITVNQDSFVKQGSYAMRTTIQADGNAYDIDDGVIFKKEELVGQRGAELSPVEVKDLVFDAVSKNSQFKKDPERLKNCVRVHYDEGHHVDIPSYRSATDHAGNTNIELASSEWKQSNPREINDWFASEMERLNELREGRGQQLRRVVRLLKRFARSRSSWNMPSGLILTMLVADKLSDYERDDECLYRLAQILKSRLDANLKVENLADKKFPKELLTKTDSDACMVELRDRLGEALEKLRVVEQQNCTKADAREAWDWFFKSGGFFDDFDGDDGEGDSGGPWTGGVGLASHEPSGPVDHRGGGRFG